MYLADPKEKMVFAAADFGGRARLGLSGGKLFSVAASRLITLAEAGYNRVSVQWPRAGEVVDLDGPYEPHLVYEEGKPVAVKYLQNGSGDQRLWLCAGQGFAAVFAVTRTPDV